MSDQTISPTQTPADPTEITIDPTQELDLTGEGLQTTTADFRIVEADIEETEFGNRWVAVFEPIGMEIDGLPGNSVRDSGYLSYDGPSEHPLASYGRSGLKRLFQAALGTPTASVAALRGATVNAKVSEGNDGFPRIKNYRPVRG